MLLSLLILQVRQLGAQRRGRGVARGVEDRANEQADQQRRRILRRTSNNRPSWKSPLSQLKAPLLRLDPSGPMVCSTYPPAAGSLIDVIDGFGSRVGRGDGSRAKSEPHERERREELGRRPVSSVSFISTMRQKLSRRIRIPGLVAHQAAGAGIGPSRSPMTAMLNTGEEEGSASRAEMELLLHIQPRQIHGRYHCSGNEQCSEVGTRCGV